VKISNLASELKQNSYVVGEMNNEAWELATVTEVVCSLPQALQYR